MATKTTAKKQTGEQPIRRIRTKAFPIKAQGGINPADARKAIAEAIRAIPDAQLKNFRAGTIMLVH